jgi:predicted kinase
MTARLVVFAGPPCSGKSTLGARLAAKLGVPHLTMDDTRARLLPHAAHTRADRQVAYRAMAFAAELLAGCGQDVILDAPYAHAEDRRELARFPLYLVECSVPPREALARFAQRDPRHPGMAGLTTKRVERLAREFPYTGKGLLLDTNSTSPEECMERIERYLAAGQPVAPGEWI